MAVEYEDRRPRGPLPGGAVKSWEGLLERIDRVGFLPLFANQARGFSVEELTAPGDWWTGDEDRDPWEWRRLIAASGRAAYGKFFAGKAGFVSRAWFPAFANWRREGYDFDSRWDDGLASLRQKKLMDQFTGREELFSFQLKALAGFGRGGEKNFEGTVTGLQMGGYLLIRDFRRRRNRRGEPYGWHISVYAAPEALWGYEHVSSAYGEEPEQSRARIWGQILGCFPAVTPQALEAAMGWRR